jgi:hypothetical protein
MGWLVAIFGCLTIVFLAVKFPKFGKALAIFVVLVVALASVAAGINSYERESRSEQSRRMIRPDELSIDQAILSRSVGWEVKGNVTNRSKNGLSGFTLNVVVQDCPQPERCVTIGQEDASIDVDVPPAQMRAFDKYISFSNMPKPTKMQWSFTIREVRGKIP